MARRPMKVRTRLILGFMYILLTVIIALEVPLAITLRQRAQAELEARMLATTLTIAANIGTEGMEPANRDQLRSIVQANAERTGARIIVLQATENGKALLVADSTGEGESGSDYATSERPEILEALDGQPSTVIRHSDELRTDLLAVAAPILDDGRLSGVVRLTVPMDEVQENVRRTTAGLVVIGLAGLLAGLLIAIVLAQSLSKPLVRLADAARRLGAGDLDARAGETRGAREIEDLATSFDDMAATLQTSVQAERDFVHNASHQLRTPLTGMKLRLESALDQTSDDDVRHQLEAADTEVDRLADIVTNLLPRTERNEEEITDLAESVQRAVIRWEIRADRASCTLRVGGALDVADSRVRAASADIDQILDNLIENAIMYAPGAIAVGVSPGAAGQVVLTVSDDGPGIPDDERIRVTERFYRGRGAPTGGSGLGLAIVRELAERWRGKVTVGPADGKKGRGTRIEVAFPPRTDPGRPDEVVR